MPVLARRAGRRKGGPSRGLSAVVWFGHSPTCPAEGMTTNQPFGNSGIFPVRLVRRRKTAPGGLPLPYRAGPSNSCRSFDLHHQHGPCG